MLRYQQNMKQATELTKATVSLIPTLKNAGYEVDEALLNQTSNTVRITQGGAYVKTYVVTTWADYNALSTFAHNLDQNKS